MAPAADWLFLASRQNPVPGLRDVDVPVRHFPTSSDMGDKERVVSKSPGMVLEYQKTDISEHRQER